MAELVDALDSKSSFLGSMGSIPIAGIFYDFVVQWTSHPTELSEPYFLKGSLVFLLATLPYLIKFLP